MVLGKKYLIVAIAIFSLLLPSLSQACMCSNEREDLASVYRDARGIYLTTISGVSIVRNVGGKAELSLELSVLKRFKGDDIDLIRGVGYSSLPVLQEDGHILYETTSCDMSYTFGDQYLIVENANEDVVVAQCSKNLLNTDQWGELIDLMKDK